MKSALKIIVCFLVFSSAAQAEEKTPCMVQADYALYVAQQRDAGIPASTLEASQRGESPTAAWARTTIMIIYGNELVKPPLIEKMYRARCDG